MIYRRITLISLVVITPFLVFSQVFTQKEYPRSYFSNPLKIPISLAGNFGELRGNHFHMGLDIKTAQQENLPVHAAAEGYIARIKIEPGGFGRALYINHPNGYTTVYCHLNDFSPKIEAYLKQQQYEQETWQIYLELPPSLFPVKKGEFIAYSGNTGGSQGPHLHFEIRATQEDVNLNPLLFGLGIPDHTRPTIVRLAIYDRNKSTYEQSPKIVALKKSGTGYVTVPELITLATDRPSFAITTYDTQSGSANLNGVFQAVLYQNEKPVTGFRMNDISYNATRYLNAHIDYRTKARGGPYLQHLSELPGYLHSIYSKTGGGDGVLDISDRQTHAIRIQVNDVAGNTVDLNFKVKYNGAAIEGSTSPGKMFYPRMLNVYETDSCEFYVGENCLYDSVRINHTSFPSTNPVVFSAVHSIGETYIPLQENFMIRIRPDKELAAEKANRIVMQRYAGSKKEVQKVEWQNGWAAARFRDFGNFQLVLDETPPKIIPSGFTHGSNLSKSSRISFTVSDNLGRVKNVRATLDGNWLRFTNDKGKVFIYRFDEKCSRGAHTLVISAEDEAGNLVSETYKFTR